MEVSSDTWPPYTVLCVEDHAGVAGMGEVESVNHVSSLGCWNEDSRILGYDPVTTAHSDYSHIP